MALRHGTESSASSLTGWGKPRAFREKKIIAILLTTTLSSSQFLSHGVFYTNVTDLLLSSSVLSRYFQCCAGDRTCVWPLVQLGLWEQEG